MTKGKKIEGSKSNIEGAGALPSPENNETETLGVHDQLELKDIYLIGSEIIKKYNFTNEAEYYKKLQEKLDIDEKLAELVKCITLQSSKGRARLVTRDNVLEWVENLRQVEIFTRKKIEHESTEITIWQDIWIKELNNFKSNFYNKKDYSEDISQMESDVEEYNRTTCEHLNEDLTTVFHKYLPKDTKVTIKTCKGIKKNLFQSDVKEFINYSNYR